jgi:tetratricopeptide (TPR) repeat protein
MQDYARAEELKADAGLVHLGRGKLLLVTGDAKKACAELDAVIEKTPTHVDALATRARARATMGDHQGAVSDYSAVINAAARPEPEHYIERAALLVAANPPRLEEALRGLNQGIIRLGSPITLVLAAFDIEVKSRQFDAALARINRAAVGVKRPEQWHVRRAEVLELAGRHPEAVLAWTQALAAVESLPPRHRQVESTVKLEGRIRQALSASNGNPDLPVAGH